MTICSALLAAGSIDTSRSSLWITPQIGPFALLLPIRSSDAAPSERPPVGTAQSHSVTTRLRSRPEGRGGACFGTAPAAIRSVHSANIRRCSPNRWKLPDIARPIGPTVTR